MNVVKPRTLSGFMELSPQKQIIFDRMVESLRGVYSSYGFISIDTPIIESSDVLLAKCGGETEKQIYQFAQGKDDVALRFDLTVPLAKYVALNYGKLAFPFRRFQIGKVYRGERAQKGRFREFYQADVDIVGDGVLNIMNDAEMISVIYKCLMALGLKRFKIRINNRKVLNGLFDILDLVDKAPDVMRAIDKMDKIGLEEVKRVLIKELGIPYSVVELLMDALLSLNPITNLTKYAGQNTILDSGVQELCDVKKYVSLLGVPEENYTIDLTIARGLDYYTSTVYETTLSDYPGTGSVCSGGRYDDLLGNYTNKKLPGVGASIGLTRLFSILDESGAFDDFCDAAPADVLIVPLDGDCSMAISVADRFRSSGIRAQVYYEDKKAKKKTAYADRLGIPYVVFIGESEEKSGMITLKDMETGEQKIISVDDSAFEIGGIYAI